MEPCREGCGCAEYEEEKKGIQRINEKV